jgi:hypothetical protein
VKKLLIAFFGVVACGTTALANDMGSLTAEVRCPGPKLYVTAHQQGTELRDLGSGILEFSGPGHIPDVTWTWTAKSQKDQLLAAIDLPADIAPGTYTAWLERHSMPYQTTFVVRACVAPSPTPTATPTPTASPTPTATPTGGVGGVTTPAPPAGGVAAAVLPNTGAGVPFELGFGLIALGLVILAGAAWLMGRRSA